MRSIQPVAMLFKRCPRGIEHFRGPAQVAGDQRDLGLGNHAPRAGYGVFGTEGVSGSSQKRLGAREIAELRHCDTSQRERWRIIPQGDSPQCSEGVTSSERTRCGHDQRLHRNPATLVTPTVVIPAAKYISCAPAMPPTFIARWTLKSSFSLKM
jgi:hypothetical protein